MREAHNPAGQLYTHGRGDRFPTAHGESAHDRARGCCSVRIEVSSLNKVTLASGFSQFDFTFDAICKIAFGLHMDQMGSKVRAAADPFLAGHSPMASCSQCLCALSCCPLEQSVHPFCFAFDDVQTITTFRSLSIPLVWKTKRALNIGNEARFKKHMVRDCLTGCTLDSGAVF